MKVKIDDPLQAHFAALGKYTDADMHNVSRYLYLKKAALIQNGAIMLALAALAAGQSVDSDMLRDPPADAWLTYHGDYTGQRHSKLSQITPANVAQLKQAWRFETGQSRPSKPRRFWWTASFTSRLPTTCGRSMRAPVGRSGIISIRKTTRSTSGTAARRCTKKPCI